MGSHNTITKTKDLYIGAWWRLFDESKHVARVVRKYNKCRCVWLTKTCHYYCPRTVDLPVMITAWFFPVSQCCEFMVCVWEFLNVNLVFSYNTYTSVVVNDVFTCATAFCVKERNGEVFVSEIDARTILWYVCGMEEERSWTISSYSPIGRSEGLRTTTKINYQILP
jgi:hypothetical protein